jgi:hypothetical protein
MTPVCCNECGADLDVGPTTNFVACARCGARLAVRRTGSSIFTERAPTDLHITDDPASPGPRCESSDAAMANVVRAHLACMEREARLANIDRQWELEREKYLVTGNFGQRKVPNAARSIFGGLVGVAFGILWTAVIVTDDRAGPVGGALFSLFGVLAIIVSAVWGAYHYAVAQDYERAHAEYRRRRQGAERGEGG